MYLRGTPKNDTLYYIYFREKINKHSMAKIPDNSFPEKNDAPLSAEMVLLFKSIMCNEHQPNIVRHFDGKKLRICDLVEFTGILRKSVTDNLAFLVTKKIVGKELKDKSDPEGYLFFLTPLGLDFLDFLDKFTVFLKANEVQMKRINKGMNE